jgi:hypothetical protein
MERLMTPQPLSDKEVLKIINGDADLVAYDELGRYGSLEQLLGRKGAVILLYITDVLPDGDVFGHWTCIFRAPGQKNLVSFFDPYGNAPDYSLNFMSEKALRQYGNEPLLTYLLRDFIDRGGRVNYSRYPLQKHDKSNAICGRMTALRLGFRYLDNDAFAQFMNSYPGLSSDQLAVLLTALF